MGFAGVMMMGAIYSLVKFVSSLISMIRWKIVGRPAVGTVGEPRRGMKSSDSKEPCNDYDMRIEYEGGSKTRCYHIEQASYIAPGTQIPLLLNPKNGDFVAASEVNSGVIVYLVAFLVCTALVVVSYFIWAAAN